MEDHRIKRLRCQAVGFRKRNAGRNRCRQAFRQVTVKGIVSPQNLTPDRSDGGKLHQRILFIIRDTQYALTR